MIRRAWGFLARLTSILGWYGLMSGLIALGAFGYGLGMLAQEYNRPKRTEGEVLHRVLSNWAMAPDDLGKNLADYTEDWRRAPIADRSRMLDRVRDSLDQLGDNLEVHDEQFPLITVVELTLRHGGDPLLSWRLRFAPGASATADTDAIPIAAVGPAGPGVELVARYHVAPEVEAVVDSAERYYNRMLRALIGLSGASLLCFGYMVMHVLNLRERVALEAAQGATLDLADRTCHELGNVAFVVANERRNLSSHIALLERFLAEEPAARAEAARKVGLDPSVAAQLDVALRREYARREIDPAFDLRQSTAIARDVCRQIAVCSDYITLTVRELDGFLKHSDLPVVPASLSAVEVIDEAVALLAPRFEAAGCTVRRPGPEASSVVVTADRRLLVHALVNLLKNAVEAASTGGPGVDREPAIDLAVRLEPGSGTAWLDVMDNGPGLVESDRRRIFDAGYSTKGAGRGQGLAIARESVRLLDGRIEVHPRPGGGTIFSIGLPAVV